MVDNFQQVPEQDSNAQINPQQVQQPAPAQETIQSSDVLDPPDKADWIRVTLANPDISTSVIMDIYGADGFNDLKSKDEYWKDEELQKQFNDSYGAFAQSKFDEFYTIKKRQYSEYQLGKFTKSQTAFELLRDDISSMRAGVSLRFENMAGTLESGQDFSEPTKDYRENFVNVRVRKVDADGNETFEVVPYTPLLLEQLEDDDSFGGLAYSDAFRGLDPNKGVNGVFFDTIHDGEIYNDATGQMEHVRNDQIVSRWDIKTDSLLDGVLKNNKIESDSIFDYAKIIAKAPINMWANLMDTGIQLGRGAIAGFYGGVNLFRGDSNQLELKESEVMKMFTNAGIRWKTKQTSMTRAALTKGFFGSLEATLMTTAEIALQVGLARGLSVAGAGVAGIVNRGLTGAALQQVEQRYAMVSVRSILTAMASKDSYNEAIESGFTTSEASMISGAMTIALWQATKYASYILGDYQGKVLRANLAKGVRKRINGQMSKTLNSIKKEVPKNSQNEASANTIFKNMSGVVDEVFGSIKGIGRKLPPTQWLYAARQEGFEEMTEELYQDIVKHGASAYGVLLNDAAAVGKGRYMTIFDDGYFKDAAERYATSGIAGAMGGPMGMVGNKVNLHNITSSSSVVDIIMNGQKTALVDVMEGMRANGELGPRELSVEWNEAEQIFEPIIQGSDQENLADMVYNTYMHDINVIDTFLKNGMFGQAMIAVQQDSRIKGELENTSMANDFSVLMGTLLDFHTRTGISMAIYPELDALTDTELMERLPEKVAMASANLEAKQAEYDKYKAYVDSKSKTTDDDADPKTTDKEKKKIAGEADETKLQRLSKELELSTETSKDELKIMLETYRNIRAISNGTAAEHYLIRSNRTDDTILGSMSIREESFTDLGENAIFDIFTGARNRFFEDKKKNLHEIKRAKEIEESIAEEFKDFDPKLDARKLDRYIRKNKGLLTEKSLKVIAKLYKPASVKVAENFLDPTKQEFIFNDENGEMNESEMIMFTASMMRQNPLTDTLDDQQLLERITTSKLHMKFFKKISKDIDKANAPFPEEDAVNYVGQDENKYMMSPEGPDLLNSLLGLTSDKAKILVQNIITPEVIEIRQYAKDAEAVIKRGHGFDVDAGVIPSARYLYNAAKLGVVSDQKLADIGLAEVEDLLASNIEGDIYNKSDDATIAEVIKQIKLKEAISDLVSSYSGGGMFQHNAKMLAEFRRNTLDILDFDYDSGESADTMIEQHPYKDYTVLSDFFTDFLFDPMVMEGMLNKDEKLFTEAENKMLTRFNDNTSYSVATFRRTPNGKHSSTVISYDGLHAWLNDKYDHLNSKGSIEKALRDIRSGEISVPLNKIGVKDAGEDEMGILVLRGVTELKVAEWLFNKTQEYIKIAQGSTGNTPYLEEKKKEIDETTAVFLDVVQSVPGLSDAVSDIVEDFGLYLETANASLKSTQELAAMNIKIENALYEVYNEPDGSTRFDGTTFSLSSIKADLDELASDYMYSVLKTENAENNEVKRKVSILIGSITTDFTPFYSRFKTIIKEDTEAEETGTEGEADRKVVLAAQEFSAKYAAGWVYSPEFRIMTSQLAKEHLSEENYNNNYIESIMISGVAGSGKTSAVTDLGMTIGASVLTAGGISTTAVLPVANNIPQVENISKSVGELSQDHEGIDVTELERLLRSATIENSKASQDKLASLSTILIDEVTYIDALSVTGVSDLKYISNLIKNYNTEFRKRNSDNTVIPIGLIIMGDGHQAGNTVTGKAGEISSTKITPEYTFPLPYMKHSFRSRNSFLGSSQSAVQRIPTGVEAGGTQVTNRPLIIGTGLKYGTSNNKFYGANILTSNNPSNNIDFIKALNNDALYNSLIASIEADSDYDVLIIPESVSDFNGSNSKIHDLMNNDKYKHAFKVIPFSKMGGSEANVVLSEFPESKVLFGPNFRFRNHESRRETKDKFNTLITRAKDFVLIINKNDDVISPKVSQAEDGQVMLPDESIDRATKTLMRKNYLDIFQDVKEGEVERITTSDNSKPPVASEEISLTLDTTNIITSTMTEVIEVEDTPLKGDQLSGLINGRFYQTPHMVSDYITALINLGDASQDSSKDISELQEDVKNKFDAVSKTLSDSEIEYFLQLNGLASLVATNTAPDAATVGIYFKQNMQSTLDTITTMVDNKPLMDKPVNEGKPVQVKNLMTMVTTELKGDKYNEDVILSSLSEELEVSEQALYDDMVDEILVSIGTDLDLDMTPPAVEADMYDAIVAETKKLVRARALELTPTEFEGFPLVEPSNQVFSEIKLWGETITVEQLEIAIADIDAAIGDPNVQSINTFGRIQDLLAKYDRDSVLKNARIVLNEVYVGKRSTDKTSTDIQQLNELKGKLGIPSDVSQELELFKAINDKQAGMGKIDLNDSKQAAVARDLEEIKAVWDNLFRTVANRTNNTFGNLYYDRNIDTAEGLQDFANQAEAIDGKNEMYTVPFNGYLEYATLKSFDRNFPDTVLLKDAEDRFSQQAVLDLFNFNGDNKRVPDKLEIRVLAKEISEGVLDLDFQVIAVMGRTKYVIAKLDTSGDKIVNREVPEHRSMPELKRLATARVYDAVAATVAAQKAGVPVDSKKKINHVQGFNGKAGTYVLDLPLTGPLKGLIKTRAGKGVVADGTFKGTTTIEQLKAKANVSDNLFVISSPSGLLKSDGGSHMRGELFTLYTLNKGVDLDSADIIKQLKQGRTLAQNLNVTARTGGITSSIGLVGVNIKAKISELSPIYQEDSDFQLGEFVSNMSLTMQRYFGEKLGDMREGDIQQLTIGGVVTDIVITSKMLEEGQAMIDSYDAYVKIDGDLEHTQKIDKALDKINNDPVALNSMNVLFGSHVFEMSKHSNFPKTRTASSITFDRGRQAYKFSINKFLGEEVKSASILNGLDAIASYAEYQIAPVISKSDSETSSVGIISPAVMKHLAPFMVGSLQDVQLPLFALTSKGLAETSSEMRIPRAIGVLLNESEIDERNTVTDFFSEDNINDRKPLELMEGETEVDAVGRLIETQNMLLKKSALIVKDEARSDAINKTDLNITNLTEYKALLIAVGPKASKPNFYSPFLLDSKDNAEKGEHAQRAINNIIIEDQEAIPIPIRQSVLLGIKDIEAYADLNGTYLVGLPAVAAAIKEAGLSSEAVEGQLDSLINNCKNK